jgi:CubicO group peptidase (beta-lactamase class C family)
MRALSLQATHALEVLAARRRVVLAIWIAIVAVPLSPRAPAAQEHLLEGLDAYVVGAMADWEVPGLALTVVRDDSVVLARGFGTRTLGRNQPVDEHTVFAIGSATTSFTTAGLGILADRGKLDWDAPAITYLPWFQLYDPRVTREITPRDLVSHRSGLPGGRSNLLWYASAYDRNEILRRVRHLKPTAGLRAEYQYQNIMFLAAGQIVAAVSGTTWDDFVRQELLNPLRMLRSTTSIVPLTGRENVASPHGKIDGEVRVIPWRRVDNIGPAGSINSTARDMAQWIRFHLAEGEYESKRILSTEMTEQFRQPVIAFPPSRGGTMNVLNRAKAGVHFFTYGLGWNLFDYRGRLVMWHGGNIDGMAAVVAMMPEEELGIVVLDWSEELLAVTREQAAEAAAARARREASRAHGTSPAHRLDDYAGRYEDHMLGEAVVGVDGGGLKFALGPNLTGRLAHWHHETFRVRWLDDAFKVVLGGYEGALVTFVTDASGGVAAMDVEGMGRFARR